jgi:hypothetical protein
MRCRVDPAHFKKDNDYTCMPIGRAGHTEQHAKGKYSFARKHGFSYRVEIKNLKNRYKALKSKGYEV